ncbi:MAG: phosphate acyltransferase PlsX [Gammaproteobacteria bacterium]|nr:phosphate acyltransferase PlsX [Gammaproteobacteria bacterium]MDH5799370.1 phosphate acyltransferase PlsX [Gammaproteobacteria bacterium]
MTESVTIALDAMGGDTGPMVTVPAALDVLKENPHIHIILVGRETVLQEELAKHNYSSARLEILHAEQTVEMDDLPSHALRNKKNSSMRVAINLVKEGRAQACVSAGNTGALMATARFVLKTIAGVDRPAIIVALPAVTGQTHVLDMGANVDSSAENLFEFAVMGSVLTSAVENIESPTVGLLNIGEEEMKGNERVKETTRLLAASNLNYIGYVEGDDVYKGSADVVVCDGFVGNVSLKTAEGVAALISHFMKQEFKRNWFTKLAGLIALPVLKAFKNKIDPRRYNGATLIGLRGIVVKSHGGADKTAFAYAIREAVIQVEKNVPARIAKQLETVLSERQAV